MYTKTDISVVDNFLFIDNLQTTVRQLNVFTAIILMLNNKQLPKKILEQLLINWSTEEEQTNISYKEAKGKITNNGVKTAALGYYLQISSLLGITTRFNDVYMNTKMSQTFLYFLSKKDKQNVQELSLSEKVFYLYKLFTTDIDGIILCLSQLNNSTEKRQRLLQVEFKEAMNNRLLSKMELAKSVLKSQLATKYRAINFTWKNAESYAEHIIAPRYEWLSSLKLVNIRRSQKDTLYSLSEKGMCLYGLLPKLYNSDIKDVNQSWLYNYFFTLMNKTYSLEGNVNFSDLSNSQQNIELGGSLEKALKAVKSSLSFKLPIIETYVFVCLDFLIEKSIIINFSDIEAKLKGDFTYNFRGYLLKLSGRINEGYITTTLKK